MECATVAVSQPKKRHAASGALTPKWRRGVDIALLFCSHGLTETRKEVVNLIDFIQLMVKMRGIHKIRESTGEDALS